MKNKFSKLIASRVLIADGAMGTVFYDRGVFVNTCFDELNLTRADLVRQVHIDYLQAGSDIIETNTFGANEIKLGKYGIAENTERINEVAAVIAKNAAQEYGGLVAGAVGPSGLEIMPFQSKSDDIVRRTVARQIRVLYESGVDLIVFETFANINELTIAVEAAGEICDLPVIAQMTTAELRLEDFEMSFSDAFKRIGQAKGVSVVGLNCSTGPAAMLEEFEIIKKLTDKPVSLQPNAGFPKEIDGRHIYMSSPEYMAEYAKRFYEKGAKIIGACCGSGPEHIRQVAKAVKAIEKSQARIKIKPVPRVQIDIRDDVAEVKLEDKSRLGKCLAQGQKVLTVEISPPRGTDLTGMLEKVRLCGDKGIDFVNIPDGPRASSRISAIFAAIEIDRETRVEPILHFCCRDKNLIGMQSDLLGIQAMGLRNILAITGDPPKLGNFPDATAVFDLDAIALTGVVSKLNAGVDIANAALNKPLSLTVGVGANPVAAEIDKELLRFNQKVENGAEYVITQPVFDVDALKRFLENIEDHKVPVIAGIWPLTSFKNAEFMANEVPGVVIPQKILDSMAKVSQGDDSKKLGIQIAREMIAEIEGIVDGFAVSAPFGNVRIALAVLGKMDIGEI